MGTDGFALLILNALKEQISLFKEWLPKSLGSCFKWIAKNKPLKSSIYYVGFNAMNPCEVNIMRTFIAEDVAEYFGMLMNITLKIKNRKREVFTTIYGGGIRES